MAHGNGNFKFLFCFALRSTDQSDVSSQSLPEVAWANSEAPSSFYIHGFDMLLNLSGMSG